MVMVARPNYTQESILGEALDELVESEMGLLGVVIDGADVAIAAEESDSYFEDEESDIIHPEEYSTVHRN